MATAQDIKDAADDVIATTAAEAVALANLNAIDGCVALQVVTEQAALDAAENAFGDALIAARTTAGRDAIADIYSAAVAARIAAINQLTLAIAGYDGGLPPP